VLEVLVPVAVESAAVEVGDRVLEVVLEVRAFHSVLSVFDRSVAEQVAHVAHVGAAIVVGVAHRRRASVHGAATRGSVGHGESDDVAVLVSSGVSLDLKHAAFSFKNRVVALVVRVNPGSAVRSRSGASEDLCLDIRTAVGEVNGHLSHSVVANT